MLTIEIFTTGFKKIRLSFEFPPDIEYQMLIFDVLKNKIDNQMFIDSCKSILKNTSKSEWNKAYGYKGRPAIKDWLDVFVPKAIEKTKYKKCPDTGANLKEIYFEYPDYYLDFLQQKQNKIEASDSDAEDKKNRQIYLDKLKKSIEKYKTNLLINNE
jgi:hypothetical protein